MHLQESCGSGYLLSAFSTLTVQTHALNVSTGFLTQTLHLYIYMLSPERLPLMETFEFFTDDTCRLYCKHDYLHWIEVEAKCMCISVAIHLSTTAEANLYVQQF